MKALIFVLLVFQSLTAYCQKIKEIEIDKFTGKKRIRTDYVKLGGGLMSGIGAGFRTVDTTIFISFNGSMGTGVVGTRDATTFLFADKTTFSVYPTSIQSYEGYGTSEHYDQQYHISKEQLEILAKNNPVSLRRTYSKYYIDVDIKTKLSAKISDLASMVLEEMNKR